MPLGFNVGLQYFLILTLMLCLVLFCFHGNEMTLVILTELIVRENEKKSQPHTQRKLYVFKSKIGASNVKGK